MALDGATYIEGMDIRIPADSDNRSEGAGQIRAVKSILKRTFPHLQGDYAVDGRPFLPIGFIGMFSGTESSLPPGWAICDGRTVNSVRTPDLRGKFIMGATSSEKPGVTGGRHLETNMGQYITAAEKELTIDEIPPHSHTQAGYTWVSGGYGATTEGRMTTSTGHQTGLTGKGKGHTHTCLHAKNFDVRPAYYVVSYIMFVGIPAE